MEHKLSKKGPKIAKSKANGLTETLIICGETILAKTTQTLQMANIVSP